MYKPEKAKILLWCEWNASSQPLICELFERCEAFRGTPGTCFSTSSTPWGTTSRSTTTRRPGQASSTTLSSLKTTSSTRTLAPWTWTKSPARRRASEAGSRGRGKRARARMRVHMCACVRKDWRAARGPTVQQPNQRDIRYPQQPPECCADWRGTRSRFLRRLRLDLTRSLLKLKIELDAT